MTYLGPLTHSGFYRWLVSISNEGSLPEITLTDESKLASTLFFVNISVHVLHTYTNFNIASIALSHEKAHHNHEPLGKHEDAEFNLETPSILAVLPTYIYLTNFITVIKHF